MANKKYKSVLGKHIEPRHVGLLASPSETEEKFLQWAKEDWEKILRLCEELDVPTDDNMWINLSLALARQHVPGFQVKSRRGPIKKWSDGCRAALVVEIDRVTKEDACSVETAADKLAKTERWMDFLQPREKGYLAESFPDPGEALRHVYYESRSLRWVQIFKEAYLYNAENNSIADWEKLVDSWLFD